MTTYDFAIIGGGPTGYAAAMYAGRLNLKTVLFLKSPGGLIITTEFVENYPGFSKISGFEIFKKIQDHAKEYGLEEVNSEVTALNKEEKYFILKTKKQDFFSKTLLFATGAKYRQLDVLGAKKFEGKGIHYCALCDGYAYKGKTVAVVGGADSAAKEALELAGHAEKVYMIYRGEKIRPEPINEQRVQTNAKIILILKTNIIEIKGDQKVTHITLDNPYNGSTNFKVDGLFIAIGHLPQSSLAQQVDVALNKKQEIIIDRYTQTNVPGVYAAGDVADTEFKQLITGCAEGVVAAYKAFNFINSQI